MLMIYLLLVIIIVLLILPYLYSFIRGRRISKFQNLFDKDLSKLQPDKYKKVNGISWPIEWVNRREEALKELEDTRNKE